MCISALCNSAGNAGSEQQAAATHIASITVVTLMVAQSPGSGVLSVAAERNKVVSAACYQGHAKQTRFQSSGVLRSVQPSRTHLPVPIQTARVLPPALLEYEHFAVLKLLLSVWATESHYAPHGWMPLLMLCVCHLPRDR